MVGQTTFSIYKPGGGNGSRGGRSCGLPKKHIAQSKEGVAKSTAIHLILRIYLLRTDMLLCQLRSQNGYLMYFTNSSPWKGRARTCFTTFEPGVEQQSKNDRNINV